MIYRRTNNHVYVLCLLPGAGQPWWWADLTADAGVTGPALKGVSSINPLPENDPIGYSRSDGLNSVVYIGQDRHVHELQLSGAGERIGVMSI